MWRPEREGGDTSTSTGLTCGIPAPYTAEIRDIGKCIQQDERKYHAVIAPPSLSSPGAFCGRDVCIALSGPDRESASVALLLYYEGHWRRTVSRSNLATSQTCKRTRYQGKRRNIAMVNVP